MSEKTEVATIEPIEQGGMLQVIERAAMNPEVDINKMQQLLDMQERIMDRNASQAYAAAMVASQTDIPAVGKDKTNPQTGSSYTSSENLIAKIKPIYSGHGLALSFSEGDSPHEAHIRILCDVTHKSGHKERYWHDLPLDDKGIKGNQNKTQVHAIGSTVSYGRRYLTMMIFNISTGDDNDGNALAPKINMPKSVRDTVYEQSIECLNSGDEVGMKQIWSEFGADEQGMLWGMFNSQQRSAIKALMKD